MQFRNIVKWVKILLRNSKCIKTEIHLEQEEPQLDINVEQQLEQPNSAPKQRIYTEEEQRQHQQKIVEIGITGERVSNFYTLPIVVYGKQLRNLYIPMPNGKTTEIDTVVITVSGIYVIETKNYNGKIYGREGEQTWTVCYPSQKKYQFYNPIKQNNTHIWSLQNLLQNMESSCYFSIIAFSESCTIQNIEYDTSKTTILKQGQLTDHFKQILKANEGKLSREKVNTIFEQLKEHTQVTEAIKQQHIKDIRRKPIMPI